MRRRTADMPRPSGPPTGGVSTRVLPHARPDVAAGSAATTSTSTRDRPPQAIPLPDPPVQGAGPSNHRLRSGAAAAALNARTMPGVPRRHPASERKRAWHDRSVPPPRESPRSKRNLSNRSRIDVDRKHSITGGDVDAPPPSRNGRRRRVPSPRKPAPSPAAAHRRSRGRNCPRPSPTPSTVPTISSAAFRQYGH